MRARRREKDRCPQPIARTPAIAPCWRHEHFVRLLARRSHGHGHAGVTQLLCGCAWDVGAGLERDLLRHADRIKDLSALILTTHAETLPGAFSEFSAGLDHVSFALPDEVALTSWEERLRERAVPFDARRSEWGQHLNFRDPDNIAVELVLLRPDGDVQAILDNQDGRSQ